MTDSAGKTGVFLLNMGGPDSLEAVQPFLENLFSDPEIIRFPLSRLIQKPLARRISTRRAQRVSHHYRTLGGKSPLREITEAQAAALEERLGSGFSVHVAMRYWHPFADEAVAKAREQGVDRIVVLPLYPHYCRATTGTSISDLDRALEAGGLGELDRTVVEAYPDYPPYLEAMADCVREAVEPNPGTVLLFSAHGVPVSMIAKGDPYLAHVEATVAGIMTRLQADFGGLTHRLAFQSRAGPVKWLEPSVEQALEALADEGVDDVTVVAVSFVSDHIETLHEIDIEYKELATKLGIANFRRAPVPNTRPAFIDALARRVEEAL
jgi:ferrochelatase